MASRSTLFLTLVLVIPQHSVLCQKFGQRAILYERTASNGVYRILPQRYAPDLLQTDFNNRAQSTCVTGIWLFYDGKNYNGSLVEYIFGENNHCVDLKILRQRVSSARYAGLPTDYRSDSLTLYERTYFQGDEESITTDLPNLNWDGDHSSLIVTGTSGWTLYSRANYKGVSVCVYPPVSNNYEPAFIYDTIRVSLAHNRIKSVRLGCV